MAFSADLIDPMQTRYADTEYGYVITTVCPSVARDAVDTLRPAKGDLYPGDTGITARRCLDWSYQPAPHQRRTHLTVRWVQPVVYPSGTTGTHFIEARGSRKTKTTAERQVASRLFISDDGVAPVSIGGIYPTDTLGLTARRVVDEGEGQEITIGLWMHQAQYVGFVEYPGLPAAYSASATYAVGAFVRQAGATYVCNTAITVGEAFTAAKWTLLTEIEPRQFLDATDPDSKLVRKDYRGSRSFLIAASGAVDSTTMTAMAAITQVLNGGFFPGFTGSTSWDPRCTDVRVEMFPEGVRDVARLVANYKVADIHKRRKGYARWSYNAVAHKTDTVYKMDQSAAPGPYQIAGANIGDGVSIAGLNEWQVTKGENVVYGGPAIAKLQTAYDAADWNNNKHVWALLRGKINTDAFYSWGAKTLLYLGPQAVQQATDTLVYVDHTFLVAEGTDTWETAVQSTLGSWQPKTVPMVDGSGALAGTKPVQTWTKNQVWVAGGGAPTLAAAPAGSQAAARKPYATGDFSSLGSYIVW